MSQSPSSATRLRQWAPKKRLSNQRSLLALPLPQKPADGAIRIMAA